MKISNIKGNNLVYTFNIINIEICDEVIFKIDDDLLCKVRNEVSDIITNKTMIIYLRVFDEVIDEIYNQIRNNTYGNK